MRYASVLLLLLGAVLSTGCSEGIDAVPDVLQDSDELAPTTVSGLDSLMDRQVSVNGQVLEQTAGERTLILDDGTGLLHVETPEPLPILVGKRLFVQGTLREIDGRPVLDAAEWLYDSTSVSFRSE